MKLASLLLGALVFPACAPIHEGGLPARATASLSPAQKILREKCLPCHNPLIRKGGVDLSSVEIMLSQPKLLKPGDPDRSDLYNSAAEGSMPPKRPLPLDQIDVLRDWIESLKPG